MKPVSTPSVTDVSETPNAVLSSDGLSISREKLNILRHSIGYDDNGGDRYPNARSMDERRNHLVVSCRCELHVIARNRTKAHAVFGHTHEGLMLTYCGIRWGSAVHSPSRNQKHCKHCTNEMRKAGMSWKWYESEDKKAANTQAHAPATKNL